MACETVNESTIDPVLAGVGGLVAVVVGLLIGFITTKFCFVDYIFGKFFSQPPMRSNPEEFSSSETPTKQLPSVGRKWKANWKKARIEQDEVSITGHHDTAEEEQEKLLVNEDFDKELQRDAVGGVVDAMLEGRSLEVALKQLLQQTLARVHMVFHDSWQYRHLATLQVFRVVLSYYYNIRRIDASVYTSILGKLQQKLESSLDANRFSLRKLEIRMRKSLEKDEKEQDMNKLTTHLLEGISLLVDEYVKGYDELRRSLSDHIPATTNNSSHQLADILNTSMQLIEEGVEKFLTVEMKEIAVRYDGKSNQMTAYFDSTLRLTSEHRVEQQVVAAAIRELAEVAEMTDSAEDEVLKEYELRSRQLYTRTMQELNDALKEMGNREREARALVHKTMEEYRKRKLQEILDQHADASATSDGLEIEECIKAFFQLVAETQKVSTSKTTSIDSEMKSMCTALLKGAHERLNSRQAEERQRCIDQVTGTSETRSTRVKLTRQLATNIKRVMESMGRARLLLNEPLGRDRLQDRWRRRLLGDNGGGSDDVTEHTLIVSKLMRDEEDDMEAFVTSQVYLPERSRAHVLDRHRTVATVVNNNQSIVTSLCLMSCDSYLICKQIAELRRAQQRHEKQQADGAVVVVPSDKDIKKVAKCLRGLRRDHEEKFTDFYQFAIHGVWKGSTNLRQTITSLAIVEKAFEALSHLMTSSNNETRCIDAIKVAMLAKLESSAEDRLQEDGKMSQMMEEHREVIRMLDQRMRRDLDHQIKICREGRETRQQLYEEQIFRREEELFRSMMTSSPAARSVSPGGGGSSAEQRFSVGDLLDSLLVKAKNDRAAERRRLENESQMSIAIYQLKLQHTQQLNNHIRELDKYLLCKVADMRGISKAQFLRFIKQVLTSANNEIRIVKKISSDFSRVWSRSFGAGKKKRRRTVADADRDYYPSSSSTSRLTASRSRLRTAADVTHEGAIVGELPTPRKRGGSFLRRLKNPPLQPVIA